MDCNQKGKDKTPLKRAFTEAMAQSDVNALAKNIQDREIANRCAKTSLASTEMSLVALV